MSMNNPSQTPGGYEPPAPGLMTAAPGAIATTPPRGISKPLLAILVVAAVLTLAIPGSLIFGIFGGHGSGLFVDRHGLPSNVPLPNGATFKFMDKSDSSGTSGDWYWTVDSPNNPDNLRSFYQSNLSSNGWNTTKTLGSSGDYEFQACQGNQNLDVEMDSTITVFSAQGNEPSMLPAPAGGSALRISLNSGPCS